MVNEKKETEKTKKPRAEKEIEPENPEEFGEKVAQKIDQELETAKSEGDKLIESAVKSANGTAEDVKKIKNKTAGVQAEMTELGKTSREKIKSTVEEKERDSEKVGEETAEEILGELEEKVEAPGKSKYEKLKSKVDFALTKLLQAGNVLVNNLELKTVLKEDEELEASLKLKVREGTTISLLEMDDIKELSKGGIEDWAKKKIQKIGVEFANEELSGKMKKNNYVKLTAVIAKNLLDVYFKIDPKLSNKIEGNKYIMMTKEGCKYLRKILDESVTAEDEKEVAKYLGKEALKIIAVAITKI